MAKHEAYWSCDRCGRKSERPTGNDVSLYLKEGVYDGITSLSLDDLCPNCVTKVLEILQPTVK